ncbi:porphobilinogen synthase [Longibacter salinarum]|uniref:Delta-aminolevulinic acid dehydratase n=1 Tax=Longibacter salinarum TaxID=1850348 RepID=A0A2A8CZI9_9BACT|nr:porphobilinogen synthase [Longibacter salinarum]PEN13818.1 porphobilinogen synthase [Longibacter salinarum]
MSLYDLPERPRRLRRTENIRRLSRETRLSTDNLIHPLFVKAGTNDRQEIGSMPGQYRLTVDQLVEEARELDALGIPGVALFPKIPDDRKTPDAKYATDADGLYPRAIRALKSEVPDLLVITDTALDPYNSDGHDGIVRDGDIDNDATLDVMRKIAVAHAEAGADIVAPSDMMDGRIGAIRDALDDAGHTSTALMSYTAKYASAYYGPFRDALDSAPRRREGVPVDKATYQMDPANSDEALRELRLDLQEGADFVMVKPALPYLDVIRRVKDHSDVPVVAYHVSGEYAMIKAASANGWLDEKAGALEALTAIHRGGADVILTYFAKQVAQWISES